MFVFNRRFLAMAAQMLRNIPWIKISIICLFVYSIYITIFPIQPKSHLAFAKENGMELGNLILQSEELQESILHISQDTTIAYIVSYYNYWNGDKPQSYHFYTYYVFPSRYNHFVYYNETGMMKCFLFNEENKDLYDPRDSSLDAERLRIFDAFINLNDALMGFSNYGCSPYITYIDGKYKAPFYEKYIILYYKENHYLLVKTLDADGPNFLQFLRGHFHQTVNEESKMEVSPGWFLYCFNDNSYFSNSPVKYGESD